MAPNLKVPTSEPPPRRTAGEPAIETLAILRQRHCAEVADRGGRDISDQYPDGQQAVEMVDGTIWVQAVTAGGRWSDIQEFKGNARPGTPPNSVIGTGGALLLPNRAEIEAYRATGADPSRTRPDAHGLEFNAANVAATARRGLGEPLSSAERTTAIREEAVRRFGEGWDQMPGPDHPEFRERQRVAPWAARVPRYRYTLVGAVLGTVRVASIFVPLLGGAFRRWEDKLMYAVERHHARTNRITEGGAYDYENGPNRDLFAEWRGRKAKVQEAVDNASGEGLDMQPQLRHLAERNAYSEAYVEALSHTPRMSSAMAELLAEMQGATPPPGRRYDWSAPDPLMQNGGHPAPEEAERESRPREVPAIPA